MVGENGSRSSRALHIIKTAITDSEVLGAISPTDMDTLARMAIEELSDSHIRMFIIKCFDAGNEKAGIVLAEHVVSHCERLKDEGNEQEAREFLGGAVGALAYSSDSGPLAHAKILELLHHRDPWMIVRSINNLPRTTNPENFGEVCELIMHEDFFVRKRAMRYVEESVADAAFSEGNKKKDKTIYKFMKNAVLPLESAYRGLRESGDAQHIRKRLAILVAMIYNEILDTLDSKEIMCEPKENADIVYYALERTLNEEIGPDALPFICKMLEHMKNEERVEVCALNTLGRMSNSNRHAERVIAWTKNYVALRRSDALINVARTILDAQIRGSKFASIAPVDPKKIVRRSLIPPGIKR